MPPLKPTSSSVIGSEAGIRPDVGCVMAEATFDVVIRGGIVYDGTGAPGRVSDVAIKDGKVAAIGPRLESRGATEIDATGKWVTPGFFDIHTHYDAEVEVLPASMRSVRHGVTTVVMGNCSLSAARGNRPTVRRSLLPRREPAARSADEVARRRTSTWNGRRASTTSTSRRCRSVRTSRASSAIRTCALAAMGMRPRALRSRRREPTELATMKAIVERSARRGLPRPLDRHAALASLGRRGVQGHLACPRSRRIRPSTQSSPTSCATTTRAPGDAERARRSRPCAASSRISIDRALGRKPLQHDDRRGDGREDRSHDLQDRADRRAASSPSCFGGNIRFQTLSEPFTNYCDGVNTPLFEEFPHRRRSDQRRARRARSKMFADPRLPEALPEGMEGARHARLPQGPRRHVRRLGARCVAGRQVVRRDRAREAEGRARVLPRPLARARLGAPLEDRGHERSSGTTPRAPREPLHAAGLQRLGRAQPQHGVPGRRAADAPAGAGVPRDDVDRARDAPSHRRSGRVARRRRGRARPSARSPTWSCSIRRSSARASRIRSSSTTRASAGTCAW